jgi:hypothetical protein
MALSLSTLAATPSAPAKRASSFKIPPQPHASFGQQVFSQFFAIDAWNISVFRRQNELTSGLGNRGLNTLNAEQHQNCLLFTFWFSKTHF